MTGTVFHKAMRVWLVVAFILFAGTSLFQVASNRVNERVTPRLIAVTFDDLPVASAQKDLASQRTILIHLLNKICRNRIPAIGFVNESKLMENESPAPARVALLQMWVESGLELGNHTFSHLDFNSTTLDDFERDVIRGEEISARLLTNRGMKLRYFRHPFLHTGMNLEIRQQFEAFLTQRGYKVAPVTIDNSDWIFARAYENAINRKNGAMREKIIQSFIPYMVQKIAYFERQSIAIFGHEIPQILLLHANWLNSDALDKLAHMIKQRGYIFVTLDEALKDSAYASRDTYIGRGGISWLDRWAITQGKKGDFFRDEPLTPEFVQQEAGVRE
jgi:peptidoglycan/xylan/chitin deacetylase (PgdA/CDA1 family)